MLDGLLAFNSRTRSQSHGRGDLAWGEGSFFLLALYNVSYKLAEWKILLCTVACRNLSDGEKGHLRAKLLQLINQENNQVS